MGQGWICHGLGSGVGFVRGYDQGILFIRSWGTWARGWGTLYGLASTGGAIVRAEILLRIERGQVDKSNIERVVVEIEISRMDLRQLKLVVE